MNTRTSTRFILILLLFIFPCEHASAAGKDKTAYRFYFSRDTIVSSVSKEQVGNCGKNKKLKLKSQQEMILFDIDHQTLKGQIISSATLHVRSASPDKAPLGRVSVSTLSSAWVEGTSKRYKPQNGASCFKQARYQQQDWAYPGSSLMDVVLGRGHTIWNFSDCTAPDKDGWQSCAVDPDIIAARIAGLSYGFCAYDDIGTTWSFSAGVFKRNFFPNRFFYSRESLSGKPFLEIQVSKKDIAPPAAVEDITVTTTDYPAGEALLSWKTPADNGGGKTLGFDVKYERLNGTKTAFPRYLIPMAGKADERVQLQIKDISFKSGEKILVSVIPVDNGGNRGMPYSQTVQLAAGKLPETLITSDITPFKPSTALPVVNGLQVSVVDLLDKINPVSGTMIPPQGKGYKGGNHLYSAEKRLVRLQSARNETAAFQLNLKGSAKDISVVFSFDGHPQIKTEINQFNYVKLRKNKGKQVRYLPDPLVTTPEKISIPGNGIGLKVPGQTNLSFIAEAYVPHNFPSGDLQGKLKITSDGEAIEIIVALTVWDFTLPNKLSFVPEMNAYSTVSPYKSHDYYRLAHKHRTCLNRLPYRWTGKPSFYPPWDGQSFDWKRWDRDVGPLLDGSAFSDLPRQGEPVDVMYLPFNENWPIPLINHYTPSYWANDAFDEAYTTKLSKTFSLFAKHCDEKGWHEPIFQFYLNNKVRYKKRNPRSSAPWTFDEPVGTKDFWALRWYGKLFHSAIKDTKGHANFWYRSDISYSQYSRDMLWEVSDIEYLGGNNFQKTRMKKDEHLYTGGYFAEYGTVNSIDEANTQPVLWCLSAWSKGATGVLPWQTIGNKKSWQRDDQNSLFYPSQNGPVPSVRLKAFTRGQQDVEYLVLYSRTYQQPFWMTADLLKSELDGLQSTVYKNHSNDAGLSRFSSISPARLWELRYRIGKMISDKAPPYKRTLVEHDIQRKHIDRQSIMGYVPNAPKVLPLEPECDNFMPH